MIVVMGGIILNRSDFRSLVRSYRLCVEDSKIPSVVQKDICAAVWGSKGHLWDMYYIQEFISNYLDPNSKILDVGCGYGFISALMTKSGYNVHGLDINTDTHPQMSKKGPIPLPHPGIDNRERLLPVWPVVQGIWDIEFTLYDGGRIPYPNDSFDGVVTIGVLEHIQPENLDFSLMEIKRVLIPGGKFMVFYTPRRRSYAEWLARLLRIGHHDVLFDDREFERTLIGSGFEIEFMGVHDMLIRGGLGLQW
ncbi:MAG TPA: class I SAM-dependent methyltransferase, partial [Candidatus Anoxymicrobiaceae bacterium]